MALTQEAKEKYLSEIGPRVEVAVDAAFKKLYGYTYRGDDVPSRRAPLPHSEKNGDPSHKPDTWEKIKRTFPSLFGGKSGDAA